MSDLGFLEKLLDGAEVEWKPLGDLGEFVRGNGLQKKDLLDEGLPAIHYGQIYTKYGHEARKTFSHVSAEMFAKLKQATANDLLLATTSENDEDVVKPLAWYGPDVAISGDMMLLKHKQNAKYLAHFILAEAFQKQKRKYITGAKVRRVSSGDLAKIEVPIPCPEEPEKSLAIQGEIVRILDSFAELTAELTAEIGLRTDQYNHYRDQLLNFEDGEVEWMPLGSVAQILNGFAFKSAMYSETGIRVVRISDVQKGKMSDKNLKFYPGESEAEIRRYMLKADDLVMSLTGNCGRVAMLSDADLPAALNQRVACIRPNRDLVLTRYLFHFFDRSSFEQDAMDNATGAGQQNMSTKWLGAYLVPIPSPDDLDRSLAIQEEIVRTLDSLTSLTTSLSENLPREIELRQKQYEYYRDLLLSFPKPAEAAEA